MNHRFNQRIRNLPEGIREKISNIDLLKNKWIKGAELDRQVLEGLKKSVLVTFQLVPQLELKDHPYLTRM